MVNSVNSAIESMSAEQAWRAMLNTPGVPRLGLGAVSDDYLLGMACQMLGLAKYAVYVLGGLFMNRERGRLFIQGLEDAGEYSFIDVAETIYRIRINSPEWFDIITAKTLTPEQFDEVMSVLVIGETRVRKEEEEKGKTISVEEFLGVIEPSKDEEVIYV